MVDSTSEEPAALALAEFKGCSAVKLGPPDDEVWHGHALDERGLEGYGTYVVEKSPWLDFPDQHASAACADDREALKLT